MTKEITINNKEKKFFFSQSFSEFHEFRLSLDIFKKRMTLIADVVLELQTTKDVFR